MLLCVKGSATSEAARAIAVLTVSAGTPVVSLQNGVENVARIRTAAPGLNAIAGMVPFNVIQPQPQQVHRATSGQIRMARTPVTESLAAQFAAAGLPLKLEDDMLAVQWGKLLLNLNNRGQRLCPICRCSRGAAGARLRAACSLALID